MIIKYSALRSADRQSLERLARYLKIKISRRWSKRQLASTIYLNMTREENENNLVGNLGI